MARSRSDELSEFLTQLKQRSTHSYEWIGKRAHLSKSTVQRYCSGQSVPREFGTIERVATLCGATHEDIAQLFRLWELAVSALPPAAGDGPPSSELVLSARSLPVTALTPEPQAPSQAVIQLLEARPEPRAPRRRRFSLGVTLVLAPIAVAVAILGIFWFTQRGAEPSAPEAKQWITGPTWRSTPRPVPSTLFGVTVNSTTGTMPTFRVGAVRLWDSGTRWSEIEPQPGQYDWTVLDRLIAGAGTAGLPVDFVFGGTPAWANPGGPVGPYPDGARAAPPMNLADWDSFVRAVVQRHHAEIEAYELWPLANDRHFFNGSTATLVEMTRRASVIIRKLDPQAKVICPGMGNLWDSNGQRALREFADAGGYNYCDVASVKLYQRSASDPPETMLNLVGEIDRLFHASGIHPILWDTGTTYSIPLQGSLPQTQARNYAVRFFLVGIYSRYVNLERMYFYNWGGTKIPIVLQADGGAPTGAALDVEQLQRWLSHAQSRDCGHGLSMGLPSHMWQCDFTMLEPGHPYDASIRWTDEGTAAMTATKDVVAVDHLDGSRSPVRAGDTITIGEEPILIERG